MERVIQNCVVGFQSARVWGQVSRFTGTIRTGLGRLSLLAGVTLAACSDNSLLDSDFPQVEIIMDSLEYGRAPLTGARVTFLIANRGPGVAYFEGCHAPIGLVVHEYDAVAAEWGEHPAGQPNACHPAAVAEQVSLDVNQAYQYTLRWSSPGMYRIQVSYGDKASNTTTYFTESPEYTVR